MDASAQHTDPLEMRKHQATAGTTTFLDHSESEVKVDRKRLLQKIDLHVMPTLFLIYMPLSWIDEKEYVLAKTHTDEDHLVPITLKDAVSFFTDMRNLLGGIMYFSIVAPIYSLAYFTPTIIQTLGYSVIQTQLHSVVPFAAALGLCLVAAYLSDAIRLRYPFVILGMSLSIAGFAVLLTVHGSAHFSAQYAGLCLVCMGGLCAGASIVCWYLMNLQGHVQRSIGSAWMIGFGNTGGIVATFAFLKADAPLYHTGYSICMAITVVGAVASGLYGALIWSDRKKARQAADNDDGRAIPSL
ncbi:MAG: hypothetical protein LQ340_002199 [Diploschistes diacapsis]|nr:MAG: hypothetical protein LQ340_002199 [Diploschistes diacapsis]